MHQDDYTAFGSRIQRKSRDRLSFARVLVFSLSCFSSPSARFAIHPHFASRSFRKQSRRPRFKPSRTFRFNLSFSVLRPEAKSIRALLFASAFFFSCSLIDTSVYLSRSITYRSMQSEIHICSVDS